MQEDVSVECGSVGSAVLDRRGGCGRVCNRIGVALAFRATRPRGDCQSGAGANATPIAHWGMAALSMAPPFARPVLPYALAATQSAPPSQPRTPTRILPRPPSRCLRVTAASPYPHPHSSPPLPPRLLRHLMPRLADPDL